MLKLGDLAQRPDLQLGPMLVSPSRRLVEGPGGHAHLEPLIMQVFLLLLYGNGRVVTRNELFDECWGGVVVGDDSLNRAILKIRRTGGQVAPGLFEIETIPRTGYRLTGRFPKHVGGQTPEDHAALGHRAVSRRRMIGGTAATAATAAGAGLWWLNRPTTDPRFDALMARGDAAFRDGSAFEQFNLRENNNARMIDLYDQATRIQPDSAKAWGLFAYFTIARAGRTSAEEMPRLVAAAQSAIDKALKIDPSEPNAKIAKYRLDGRMLEWIDRDRLLRSILAKDPTNILAMMELMPLLQSVGLTRESWVWNERILAASPSARSFLVFRSMKLWILGRTRESDNVLDRVRGLWPDFGFAYWIRFVTFALTNRASAALAMLNSAPDKLGDLGEQQMWRTALRALDTHDAADIAAARTALLNRADKEPELVNDIVMLLGALGQIDAAFGVTEGFLLWRGKFVSADHADGKKIDDYSRRMTQWLFTPPMAAVRNDARFPKLCDDFGLTDYWKARNVQPDYKIYV